MKVLKPIVLSLGSVFILVSCTTNIEAVGDTASNIGMNIFKTAVDNKCRTELNNQPIYRAGSMILTDDQKQSLEDKICGCVSEKAPKSVTLAELGQVAIDQNARTQIVTSAVSKTISACIGEFIPK